MASFTILRSLLHTSSIHNAKVIPQNFKGKSVSSQEWLKRQWADPYVQKARIENYRCRSAFKLLEIDQRTNLIQPGQTIIDCGAAPGSWTQVAVVRSNANGAMSGRSKGLVIGIDRLQIYPIEHATLLGGADFTRPETQERIKTLLAGRPIDLVLSDMAPNASGVRCLDQENIIDLCFAVLRFAVQMSAEGGALLVKVWDGGDVPKLEENMRRFYGSVKHFKPRASRGDSAEKYILARGFVGCKCLVRLGDSFHVCHIQEIRSKDDVLVFVEDFGKKMSVTYAALKDLPAVESSWGPLPRHVDRHRRYSKLKAADVFDLFHASVKGRFRLESLASLEHFQPPMQALTVAPLGVDENANKIAGGPKGDASRSGQEQPLEEESQQVDLMASTSESQAGAPSYSYEPAQYYSTGPQHQTSVAPYMSYPGGSNYGYSSSSNVSHQPAGTSHGNRSSYYSGGRMFNNVNYSIPLSQRQDGADLPFDDVITLRYFFNFGVEAWHKNNGPLDQPSSYRGDRQRQFSDRSSIDAAQMDQMSSALQNTLKLEAGKNDRESNSGGGNNGGGGGYNHRGRGGNGGRGGGYKGRGYPRNEWRGRSHLVFDQRAPSRNTPSTPGGGGAGHQQQIYEAALIEQQQQQQQQAPNSGTVYFGGANSGPFQSSSGAHYSAPAATGYLNAHEMFETPGAQFYNYYQPPTTAASYAMPAPGWNSLPVGYPMAHASHQMFYAPQEVGGELVEPAAMYPAPYAMPAVPPMMMAPGAVGPQMSYYYAPSAPQAAAMFQNAAVNAAAVGPITPSVTPVPPATPSANNNSNSNNNH